MTKEELLNNDEFLKRFSSGSAFSHFMSSLYKRGVEKMFEGELDAHLGYHKHEKSQGEMPEVDIRRRPSRVNKVSWVSGYLETETGSLHKVCKPYT